MRISRLARFPSQGHPAFAPWRLALVTIRQFAEGVSDRQAAEAVRVRLDGQDAITLALTHASREKPAAEPPVAAEVAGEWDLRIKFLRGERTHRLLIEQRGSELSGQQHSADFDSPVVGRLTPEGVDFSFDYRYEGSSISYHFLGQANGRTMTGTVVLGAVTDHHQGIVNLAQFGTGDWQASRVGLL